MRFVFAILIMIWLSGCASKPALTMYENDQQMILKDRWIDLPMPFIYPSMQYQNNVRCFKDQFCSLFPEFKDKDFKIMNHPWTAMTTMYSYSIGLGQTLQNGSIVLDYGVSFNSSISPYSQADRALENGDEEFISKKYKQGIEERGGKYYQNGRVYYINAHIEKHGQENYSCVVFEELNPAKEYHKVETREKTFSCIKSNPEKTMTKEVNIILTYTKVPDLPKELEPLAKEYTYEDLQKRSQRILDSLYIKDGWDK